MSKQASAKVEAECQATVFRSAGQQAFLWMLKLDGKPGRDTYVQLPELAESARTSEWLSRCCIVLRWLRNAQHFCVRIRTVCK